MRKWLFALVFNMLVFQLWAQDNYYIYIQSEDGKLFFVKAGTKVLESSGNGYLLIPELAGQAPTFSINFPDQPGIEWKFDFTIGNEDQAYILRPANKNKPPELSVLKQGKNITGTKVITDQKHIAVLEKKATGIVSDDVFSTMLAQVVSDPSIRQQPVIIPKQGDSLNIAKALKKDSINTAIAVVEKQPEIKKEEKAQVKIDSNAIVKIIKKDSAKALVAAVEKQPEIKKEEKAQVKIDSSAIAKATTSPDKPLTIPEEKTIVITDKPKTNTTVQPEIKKVEIPAAAKVQPPTVTEKKNTAIASANVKKTLQRKSNEGIELIYIDELSDGTKDTIRILIPATPQ